jgi:hypothetical protein
VLWRPLSQSPFPPAFPGSCISSRFFLGRIHTSTSQYAPACLGEYLVSDYLLFTKATPAPKTMCHYFEVKVKYDGCEANPKRLVSTKKHDRCDEAKKNRLYLYRRYACAGDKRPSDTDGVDTVTGRMSTFSVIKVPLACSGHTPILRPSLADTC